MSQSGIPVVSQAAKIVDAVVSVPIDIVSGKNVFESAGRAIGSIAAAPGDIVHDVTFGYADKLPILGDVTRTSNNFNDNPFSRDAALDLARTGIKTGAVVGATLVGAPYLAGATGLSAGASTIAAAGLSNSILSGRGDQALNQALGYAGGIVGDTDIGSAFNTYGSEIKGILANQPRSIASAPVNNFSAPAQQVIREIPGSGMNLNTVLVVLAVAGGVYVIYKKGGLWAR